MHPFNRVFSSSYLPGPVLHSWHTMPWRMRDCVPSLLEQRWNYHHPVYPQTHIQVPLPVHNCSIIFLHSRRKRKKDHKQHGPLQISRCCIVWLMDQLWVMGAGFVWEWSEFYILEEEKKRNSIKTGRQKSKEQCRVRQVNISGGTGEGATCCGESG